LKVGVAGCHRQTTRAPGSHNFSAALALNPQVEIVAAFDHGVRTRAAYVECWQNSSVGSKLQSHNSLEGMLASEHPDIVVISARQTFHAEMIETAVAAGARGILVDKPLCTSLVECDRIVHACERAGVPLLYALDRRYSSRWAALREVVEGGAVGTVQSVAVSGVFNTVNHGCHYTDLAMGLMSDPEPVWVSAQLVDDPVREWVPPPPAEMGSLDPASNCTVGFSNGAVAVFTPAGSLGVDVVGDKGRLVVWGDASAATLWDTNSQQKEDLCLPAEDTSTWPAGQRMVADLVQVVCSSSGKTACDTDCARRATEIAFGAHWSSDRGGARVELPLAVRTVRVESLPWGNEGSHHPDVAESSNPNNPWAH
jgi:predicted dehydrogenase